MVNDPVLAKLSQEERAFLERSKAAQAVFAAVWLIDLPSDLRPHTFPIVLRP